MRRKGGGWRHERDRDVFVHEARRRGLRSRAAFKLEELDSRDHLFRDARVVVDLGASPGGWSQIARRRLPPDGRVVALDILEMEPLAGVEFIHGDFLRADVLARLEGSIGPHAADLVMSDMAPNLSGMRVNDQARWRELAEAAAWFAETVLKPHGAFLVKLFQGGETESYLRALRERFASVSVRKPAASRKRSTETYALARCLTRNVEQDRGGLESGLGSHGRSDWPKARPAIAPRRTGRMTLRRIDPLRASAIARNRPGAVRGRTVLAPSVRV